MKPPSFVAVELTHVLYPKGDFLGHFLAWVSLVPIFISIVGFISHFIFRREIQGMLFSIGHITSQFIILFIKESVKQARPETCVLLEVCHSHGWPSNHSHFMFFFATYITLLAHKTIGFLNGKLMKWIVTYGAWIMAFLTMYSRVYLGYHTFGQVLDGALLGVLMGGVWFWVVNFVLSPYFVAIEESVIGRMLYIKDTSHLENVLEFEYQNARVARKAMDSKSN